MKLTSSYTPLPKQVEAHVATEQLVGYGGAMGGGKTRWLCEMAKHLSLKFPNNFGLLARQSGPALRVSTMEVFFSETLIPGSDEWEALGCKFSKTEGILTFGYNNSRIWFTGLDSDNVERVKSLNLGFFGIDEATDVAESTFLMLCTRLRRHGVPTEYRKGMITANPEAGWVKRRFVDQKLSNHKFIPATSKDNSYLPDDYEHLFDTFPDHWREKYLFGNWDAASGLIYKAFDPDFHIIPDKEFPPYLKYVRGLDHGQTNPTACIGAVVFPCDRQELVSFLGERTLEIHPDYDSYPVIIANRLYYNPGLVSTHRKNIHKLFKDVPNIKSTYADPSIFANTRERMVENNPRPIDASLADEYRQSPYPVNGLRRANNAVLAGINRVETLHKIGHIFYTDHPSMKPLIGDAGEIRNYQWKEPRVEDDNQPEVPIKRNDHALDAWRYLLMSFPTPKPKPRVELAGTFVAATKLADAWKKLKHRSTYYDHY